MVEWLEAKKSSWVSTKFYIFLFLLISLKFEISKKNSKKTDIFQT